MRIIPLIALAALLAPLATRGDHLATQPGDLATPKKALKFFDRVGADPKIDRANLFYHATNDNERKVAKAFASVDFALAKLRKQVATRFDDTAGNMVVHALRDVTADDIDAARESVDGDKATISGKNFGEPLLMIRVNGNWKIDIGAALAKSNADPDQLVDLCEELVDAIDRTSQELSADKYPNPSLLDRAIKRRVKGILGGE